jgi:hypothetical protein
MQEDTVPNNQHIFPIKIGFSDTGTFQNRKYIQIQLIPLQDGRKMFLWEFCPSLISN